MSDLTHTVTIYDANTVYHADIYDAAPEEHPMTLIEAFLRAHDRSKDADDRHKNIVVLFNSPFPIAVHSCVKTAATSVGATLKSAYPTHASYETAEGSMIHIIYRPTLDGDDGPESILCATDTSDLTAKIAKKIAAVISRTVMEMLENDGKEQQIQYIVELKRNPELQAITMAHAKAPLEDVTVDKRQRPGSLIEMTIALLLICFLLLEILNAIGWTTFWYTYIYQVILPSAVQIADISFVFIRDVVYKMQIVMANNIPQVPSIVSNICSATASSYSWVYEELLANLYKALRLASHLEE